MSITKELLEKYNMASLETYKEMFGDSLDTEKNYYRTFLIQTDHIPNKIIEKLIEDLAAATLFNILEIFFNFITSVKVEYREILQYRKQARKEINELEAAAENPTAE